MLLEWVFLRLAPAVLMRRSMRAYAFLHFYISTAVESVEMWKSGETLDWLPRLVHSIDGHLCISTALSL